MIFASLKNACLFLALLVCSSFSLANEKPNIVVLFSDDGGYADFGFQENVSADMAKLTPNIDSIARDGVYFKQAYVTGCVCSPSRAGLMTGRYQQRFGHDCNLPVAYNGGLPLSETMLALRLKSIGYHTGLIGKWHLGYPKDYQPNSRGFDYFHGLLQGARKYHPYDTVTDEQAIRINNKLTEEYGYVTDRLGDAACEYIDDNKDKSFFLFVSFTAPHSPLEPREGYEKEERLSHIKDAKRKKYAGLITAMDDNVGKILEKLNEHDLADNTLVIFTNDNGGPGPNKTMANNYPLRGFKGGLYEGGIRIPWAMRLPGMISPGSVVDTPIITLDITPTIFDLAGAEINNDWQLDGNSLVPLLRGDTSDLAERTFYWRRNGSGNQIAIRDGNWKLIIQRRDPQASPELFNLQSDVGESEDLAAEQPEVVSKLMDMLTSWESELSEPLWYSNNKKNKKK